MSRHPLAALSRRMDAAFSEMERTWAIYRVRREPDELAAYLIALRRCQRLHDAMKNFA